jgi:hypothetical protein
MSSPIAWDDDPSFPSRLTVQVFNPPAKTSFFIRMLGPCRGVWTHYLVDKASRRSAPHLLEDCPHCKKDKKRWKVYGPAILWTPRQNPKWTMIVIEFTAFAWEQLVKLTDPKELRGKVLEVSKRATNSKMYVRLVESPDRDVEYLPPPFDVTNPVQRLWGLLVPTPRGEHVWEPTPPPEFKAEDLPPPVEQAPAEPTKKLATNFGKRFRASQNGGVK